MGQCRSAGRLEYSATDNPGGQFVYSELAIETGMMLRLAFHLALRQAEGLMDSIFELLNVPLTTPDHSTLSRRSRAMESISNGCVYLMGRSTC